MITIPSRPAATPVRAPAAVRVAALIDAMGDADFELRLQEFLSAVCDADHFGVFRLGGSEAQVLSSDPTTLGQQRLALYKAREMWRLDPVLRQAMQSRGTGTAYLVRPDMTRDVDPRARVLLYGSIRDRYILFGGRAGAVYGLSVLHSADAAGAHADGMRELQECGELLLSILARHYEGSRARTPVSSALSSLDDIESRIGMHAALPPREGAVCARLVYGMMIPGIALDLGIGEESAKTYRKRLYRRLNISTPRELLVWYLELADTTLPPMPRAGARDLVSCHAVAKH